MDSVERNTLRTGTCKDPQTTNRANLFGEPHITSSNPLAWLNFTFTARVTNMHNAYPQSIQRSLNCFVHPFNCYLYYYWKWNYEVYLSQFPLKLNQQNEFGIFSSCRTKQARSQGVYDFCSRRDTGTRGWYDMLDSDKRAAMGRLHILTSVFF